MKKHKPAMQPHPSCHLVPFAPFAEILLAVRAYEASRQALRLVRASRPRSIAKKRLRCEVSETAENFLDGFEANARDSIRQWLREGCPEIDNGNPIFANIGNPLVFVTQTWISWRYINRFHPLKKNQWLRALPEEVSGLIDNIQLHLKNS